MAKFILLIVLLPIFMLSTSLQAIANANIDCNNAYTTPELNYCAQQAFNNANQQLQIIYKQALNQSISLDKQNNSEEIANGLRETQKAWLVFLKLNCNNQLVLYKGGSEAKLQYLTCKKDMIDGRALQLKQMYLSS